MFLVRIVGACAAAFLNLLDFVLFYILFCFKGNRSRVHDLWFVGTDRFKQKSVPVPNAVFDASKETAPYRNKDFVDALLETPIPEVRTMGDLFRYAVKQYASKPLMGSRPIIGNRSEYQLMPDGTERQVTIPQFGDMQFLTYEQVAHRVSDIHSGLKAFAQLKPGDKIGIFEETCQEWMMIAQACMQHSIVIVTVYANLGDDALVAAFNETKITTVFTSEARLCKFRELASKMPNLKYIVYNQRYKGDSMHELVAKEIQELQLGIKAMTLDEVESLGKQSPTLTDDAPTPDDLALIMYTSGTTGKPKGVMISHRNVLSAVAALGASLGDDPEIDPIMLGYLPLAHILELVSEHYAMLRGSCIGYGSPKTLTDRGAKPVGDLIAVKPVVMCGVPRVWDTVKKTGRERLSKRGALSQWLFRTAYDARKRAMAHGRDTPLWNFLVFNNFRSIIGGRIRCIICGGASLSAESQEFMRICVGCVVVQGYGLTETCAAACVQSGYHEFTTQRVGAVVPSCEVKLVSVPDMNYCVTDKPNPRGEIWVRGNNVTRGYYEQEKLTREVFREDGWFLTGDIGELFPDGTFALIDRKKNLIKLDNGEYVALEKLESYYSNSPFVAPNGICIYGDSSRSYLVAIVLPQVSYLTDWAKQQHLQHADNIVELCKNETVRRAVLESLELEAKKNNVRFFECIKDVRLAPDEWTPENGMMTAAQKLVRNALAKRYETEIAQMYAQ